MVLDRRRALHLVGTTVATSLAGCTSSLIGSDQSKVYTLDVDRMSVSPVADALYEPGDDALFGESARTALENVLPDGRHTTYGYTPLPEDAYVEHEGTYYQTKSIVTGRREMARQLVRVDPIADDEVPEDAIVVDALARPSARVVKILHSNVLTDGEGGSADLLHGDAYVLRRPVELESRLATGDLDGRVVTMTPSGGWPYRIDVTRERVTETAHTTLAIEVADTREEFREVVFGSRIDVELAPDALSVDAREKLEQAIARDRYQETEPLSEGYDELLERLGLDDVDGAVNDLRLWYDGDYFRYGLYINDAN